MFSTVNLFHPLSFNMELPETNSAPENEWLEVGTLVSSWGPAYSQGQTRW